MLSWMNRESGKISFKMLQLFTPSVDTFTYLVFSVRLTSTCLKYCGLAQVVECVRSEKRGHLVQTQVLPQNPVEFCTTSTGNIFCSCYSNLKEWLKYESEYPRECPGVIFEIHAMESVNIFHFPLKNTLFSIEIVAVL
jgi:hypothetical protein